MKSIMKKTVAAIASMSMILSALPVHNVFAEDITETVTVVLGEEYTLPEMVNNEAVTWSGNTEVSTDYVGIQKFTGTTADGDSVEYTVNVGKQVTVLDLKEDMEDYTVGTTPELHEDGSGLGLISGKTGYTSTIEWEDSTQKNKVWQKSGYNSADTEYVQVSKTISSDVKVEGKIKINLSSITADNLKARQGTSTSFPATYLLKANAQNPAGSGTGGTFGGFGIRLYTNSTYDGIRLTARPMGDSSTSSGITETYIYGTKNTYGELSGEVEFTFEVEYNAVAKTFTVKINDTFLTTSDGLQDIPYQYKVTTALSDYGFKCFVMMNRDKLPVTYTIDDIKIYKTELATVKELPSQLTDTIYLNTGSEHTKNVKLELTNGDTVEATARYNVDTAAVGTYNVDATVDGFTDTVPMAVTVEEAAGARYINISEGKTATASASFDTTSTPDKAVDGLFINNSEKYGNAGNKYAWRSDSTEGAWWQVDLGETKAVTAIKLTTTKSAAEEEMKNFKVLASEDGNFTNSTEIAVCGDEPFGVPGERFIKTFSTPVNARYIRVVKTAAEAFRIDEFAVYETQYNQQKVTGGEAVTRFAIVSDVHVSDEQSNQGLQSFNKVMEQAKELYGAKLDGVIVNGDIINNGTLAELNYIVPELKSSVSSYNSTNSASAQLILNNGNHEINDSSLTNEGKDKNWLSATGNDSLYQSVDINGVRVIAVGMEAENPYPSSSVTWLEEQLETYKDVPVLLAIHYPVMSTIFSSTTASNNCYANYRNVINKYPNVTVLSSHIHKAMYSPQNIWQNNNFTAIGTGIIRGCTTGTLYVDSTTDYSQVYSLFCEVDADGVMTFKEYDVTNDVILDSYSYKPGNATTYAYTDDRELRASSPAFADGEVITEVEKSDFSIKISFPKAEDYNETDSAIEAYGIKAVSADGTVASQKYISGLDNAEKYEVSLGGLTPETEYTIYVTAYNAWNKSSEPISIESATAELNVDGNIALNKTVTVSSISSGQAAYLTDGILNGSGNNWWGVSSGVNATAVIDLGAQFDIGAVVINTRKNTTATQSYGIELQLSNTPDFTDDYITIGKTPDSDETPLESYDKDLVIELSEEAKYRYVRLVKAAGAYAAIPEVLVYAKENSLYPCVTDTTVEDGNLTSVTIRTDATVSYSVAVLVAVYDENERLVSCKEINGDYKPNRNSTEETINVSDITIGDEEHAKVFVWTKLKNRHWSNEMSPELEVYKVPTIADKQE